MNAFVGSLSLSRTRAQQNSRNVSGRRRVTMMAKTWHAQEISKNGNVFGEVLMTPQQIINVLPHRYPFLLVDKVVEKEDMKRIVGVKNVTFNEPQFTGHFPERPIMPGVLMVEALAQLSGLLVLAPPLVQPGTKPDFFFGGIDNVRFRRPVVPGDTLVMEVQVLAVKERFGIAKVKGQGYVNGELAVEAELLLTVVKDKK